jgi:hypothetical protein
VSETLTAPAPSAPVAAAPEHLGVVVEFATPDALLHAAEKVRDAGYTKWDCHTPFPVHGLDKAMGIKPTILPWIVLGGAITGGLLGLFLQCYTNGDVVPFSFYQSKSGVVSELLAPFFPSGYPYVVSGKPIYSVPANIPIVFELTVLLGAFSAFFGMLGLNGLPSFFHPVFTSPRFKRASNDRYFVSIEANDPKYDRARTRAFVDGLGGVVEELEG